MEMGMVIEIKINKMEIETETGTEMEWNGMKWNEIKWNEINESKTKLNSI